MNESKLLRCPVFTVWLTLNINILFHIYDITIFQNNKSDNEIINLQILKIFFEKIYIYSLLILFLLEIFSSIIITVGIYKKDYCEYVAGSIMFLLLNLLITFHLIIFNFNEFILILLLRISMQWIQLIILMIHTPLVVLSSKNSYLNANLINDFPQEGQSLLPEQKKEEESV